MEKYDDIAIPIAWPNKTARGDEAWMAILKKVGLVKNLNFKVGHAAVVMVERNSGEARYYDYGRYLTPRGFGRARSVNSDPRLVINTRATFDENGKLSNLDAILEELSLKELATHGKGRLLCSLTEGVSFLKGTSFAEKIVESGPSLYGALAPGNNSCSRYVAQIIVAALPRRDPRIRPILYPEFIKASPTSNVVNGSSDYAVYSYENGFFEEIRMTRMQSVRFHFNQLSSNFTQNGSKNLGDDHTLGSMVTPDRVEGIPANARWVGGLGEGCWFTINPTESGDTYCIQRFDEFGGLVYQVYCKPEKPFDIKQEYEFTFDIQLKRHSIRQNKETIAFCTESYDIAPH